MKPAGEPPVLSVILCTHNPRPRHLAATVDGLRAQTLPSDCWELLVVDNASDPQVEPGLDVAWHPGARVISEPRLGLTHARLRGVQESSSPVLVFVDDDNVLQGDYLEQADRLGRSRSGLGAWGGQVVPRFEQSPPDWIRPYWPFLGLKDVSGEIVSRDPEHWPSTPIGAGLCVKREVADQYRRALDRQPWRRELDRRGPSLMSAGDQDLANTACDLGLEKGLFPEFRVDHLIPPERTREDYLLALATAIECSNHMLRWCRDPRAPAPVLTPRRLVRYLRNLAGRRGRDRRFYLAQIRGERSAVRLRRALRQAIRHGAEPVPARQTGIRWSDPDAEP